MPATRLLSVVETYLATVDTTTLYRVPADADVTGLHAGDLATRLLRLGADPVHSSTEVVAGTEGCTESVSVSEVNDPPGTVVRSFDDGRFLVVCADDQAYPVSVLEPGDIFFDEQSPGPVALCVIARGYRRRDGRYEIRAVADSDTSAVPHQAAPAA